MYRSLGLIAVLLAMGATAAGGQNAPQQPPPAADQDLYTYVALWSVPRADWNAIEKYYASLVPTMKKLSDSGSIEGWGQTRAFVHDESGITHLNWFTAKGFAGLSKALDAIRASGPTPAALGNADHWDEIMRSTVHGGKPGAGGTAMMWVARYELQSGQSEDFSKLFEDEIKPLFEEQVAAGTVLSYAVSFEAVHTVTPNMVSISYILADAAAIDKFQAALAGYQTQHPRAGAALEEVMNVAAHRDAIFEVLAFGQK
jgi:hypothetical protein